MTTNGSGRPAINLSAGESRTVTIGLTATQRLSDVRIETTDPLGLTVTSEPEVVDDLDAGERTSYTFTVRADRSVSRTLNVVVRADRDNQSVSQRLSYSVDALNDSTNTTRSGAVQADAFATATTRTSPNGTSAAAPASGVSVSGRAMYTDPSGELYALSGVVVELYDTDGDTTRLARTQAASNGEFTVQLDPETDADGDGTIDATVVVYAENDAAYVSNTSSVYRFATQPTALDAGDTVTLGSDIDDDGSKELVSADNNAPFQAVDWAYEAYEFGQSSFSARQIPIVYPVGDWAYFRYRTDGQRLIQLPPRSSYPWDRTTMYHEYGHSVHFELRDYTIVESGQYSCHVQMSETDPGYALVEGFAEYYAAAVADNPNALRYGSQTIEDNRFYDTAYTGQCANGDANGEYDGLSVEGSAASIFWDITDGGSGDDDPISYDFDVIAETLRADPGGMNEFYNAWRGGNRDALDEIYTNYGIDRSPPTISYSVSDTPYTDSDVRLSGTVDDERAVTDVSLSVNGGPYRSIQSTGGRWSVSRTLPDGTSTVSVRATDTGGFTREVTRTVRVSSTAPSASVTDARSAALESSDASVSVDFSYTARYPETATVRLRTDDTTVATTSLSNLDSAPAGTDTTATVALPETATAGDYTVEVVLTDAAGRTTTARYNTTFGSSPLPPTIRGAVVDESDTALTGATVALYAAADTDLSAPLYTTRTNTAGSYNITAADAPLRSGESYIVRASFDGANTTRTLEGLRSGLNDGDIVLTTTTRSAGVVAFSNLSPESATVAPNGTFTVSVVARNTGETSRLHPVELRLAGTTVATKLVRLVPGENTTVVFDDIDIGDRAPGEYRYSVAADESSYRGTVTVEASTTDESPLAGRYDVDDDGRIDAGELGAAGEDFTSGEISAAELGALGELFASTAG